VSADVWFGAILVGLVLYVALDGNDLGIGILAMGTRDGQRRRDLLDLVASVWDGNESWILLVVVGLWGGFPAAAGGLLPAVYPLLIVMVWSLIVRGVSIEMISNTGGWPAWWGRAFMAGSLLAAFVQGMVIGAVIHGVPLGAHQKFTGDPLGFFSGFSVLTGLATIVLYCVHGAALVRMRGSDPAVRATLGRWGRKLIVLLAALAALTGGLIPVAGAASLTLGQPLRVALMTWVCVAAALCLSLGWWALGQDRHGTLAFVMVALAEVAGLAGLAVLSYPDILPPSLTIAAAASPPSSLDLLIGGFGMLVPVTIAYNAYAFWILRPRRAQARAAVGAEAGR
jgi:cytochrome bd ubiquinol oxidase subunit II